MPSHREQELDDYLAVVCRMDEEALTRYMCINPPPKGMAPAVQKLYELQHAGGAKSVDDYDFFLQDMSL